MTKVAIIGSGLAGLNLATRIQNKCEVTVFEKARGVGGRMSTRRAGSHHFDHGAPFFRASEVNFKNFLEDLIPKGVISKYAPKLATFEKDKVNCTSGIEQPDFYVATPNMNSLSKHLANDLNLILNTRASHLTKLSNTWNLIDENNISLGEFDWVISTAPAPQTSDLFTNHSFSDEINPNIMQPCIVLMLGFNHCFNLGFDYLKFQNDAILDSIYINNTKPGRTGSDCLVIHCNSNWSKANVDNDRDKLKAKIISHCSKLLSLELNSSEYQSLHVWRYAIPKSYSTKLYHIDASAKLAACGDWCLNGDVESAFLSSEALANELLNHI